MKISVRLRPLFLPLLVLVGLFVPAKNSQAQSEDVTLDIQLAPVLENAQVLGLANLGINKEGFGQLLVSGSLTNNTDQRVENLFLEITLDAARAGILVRITQDADTPISMEPFQVLYATNNDIQNETIPGLEGRIEFSGGLTALGEQFIENLDNVSSFPIDIYTLNVNIFKYTLADGKEDLVGEIVEVGGGGGVISDERSIFLRTPGDVIGSQVGITNPFPQLSWEGDAAGTYRVIVVKDNGQDSPESLIESARSSAPVVAGGSLLQFENLDFRVTGNTLQYPSSGAQPLVPGQTYYWQVSTGIQSASGNEVITSEIWSFKLNAPGSELVQVPMSEEVLEALIMLIGQDQYSVLTENGYSLESITLDGQTYSGVAAIEKLSEVFQKTQDGEIIVGN